MNNSSLSSNTQAILLLTAPLIIGKSVRSDELVSLSEYKKLARFLHEKQRQPGDLLDHDNESLIIECSHIIDSNRIKRLLDRGFLLSQALERWNTRSIWVISRADSNYPKRLKTHLKEDAPVILYGCGDQRMLDNGGLAVVGSRNVDEELITYTEGIGRLAADAERNLVSGGARGIDQAAMRGALEAGGRVVGVLADSLEKAAMNREHRTPLMSQRLVLVSPFDPSAGFNVGNAMQRNKLIYALSDAALVVSSDYEKGGTWTGAVEQLGKLKYVPVYVRSVGVSTKGLDGLRRKGAQPWPNPSTSVQFNDLLASQPPSTPTTPIQADLLSVVNDVVITSIKQSEPIVSQSQPISAPVAEDIVKDVAKELFAKVKELLLTLPGSNTESELATKLDVSKSQMKAWLERAMTEGWIEKRGKPIRYSANSRLPGL